MLVLWRARSPGATTGLDLLYGASRKDGGELNVTRTGIIRDFVPDRRPDGDRRRVSDVDLVALVYAYCGVAVIMYWPRSI